MQGERGGDHGSYNKGGTRNERKRRSGRRRRRRGRGRGGEEEHLGGRREFLKANGVWMGFGRARERCCQAGCDGETVLRLRGDLMPLVALTVG